VFLTNVIIIEPITGRQYSDKMVEEEHVESTSELTGYENNL